VLLALVVLGLAPAATAREVGPQSVVRRFCRADGVGQRVGISEWNAVAPLVAWPLEPAWDHVLLVASYQVGSPRALEKGRVEVDVDYTVIGQVSALGLETGVHVETVTFALEAADGRWRILGPPPAPHLFWNRVDVERLRRSLAAGDVNFAPNTLFVYWMLRSVGWNVPLVPTSDLLSGETYRVVREPKPGDVVIYLRDGIPYHVGFLEADDQVVSSTLNAGIVRSVIGAFAGEVEYFRLVQPEAKEEAVPDPTPVPAATPAGASPVVAPEGGPRRTPAPTVRHAQRRRAPSQPTPAQRSKKKRVQKTRGGTPPVQRTPSSTPQTPRPDTPARMTP
jgi:hypothetical protein